MLMHDTVEDVGFHSCEVHVAAQGSKVNNNLLVIHYNYAICYTAMVIRSPCIQCTCTVYTCSMFRALLISPSDSVIRLSIPSGNTLTLDNTHNFY